MARRGVRGDVDAVRSAIRPRLGALGAGGTGGGSTTLPAHTHSADKITFEPNDPPGHLSADDVQEALEELDSEKLARDGSQTMLGALDMDHNSIANADDLEVEGTATVLEDANVSGNVDAGVNLHVGQDADIDRDLNVDRDATVHRDVDLVGGVGEAIVTGARVIHMAGDHADDEAKIDGLERVVFNDEPTASRIEQPSVVEFNTAVEAGADTTAKRGAVGFDKKERLPYTWFESVDDNGSRLHKVPWGWVVLQCVRGENGGAHLDAGTVVMLNGGDVNYEGLGEHLPKVDPYDSGDAVPLLTNAHKVIGITMGRADRDELVPVMRRGRWHTASGGWTAGDLLWCGAGGSTLSTSDPGPGVRIFVGTVIFDDSTDAIVDVDVQVMPTLGELSFMATVDPDDYYVPIFHEGDGYWTPGLLPAVGVTYDPSSSNLTATDVQAALDELASIKAGRRWSWLTGD